jgi:hypothetical protein
MELAPMDYAARIIVFDDEALVGCSRATLPAGASVRAALENVFLFYFFRST